MSISSYVTGSSTLPYSASVPIPSSGTIIYADDIIQPVRTLADRTAFLSGTLFVPTSQSLILPLKTFISGSGSNGWAFGLGGLELWTNTGPSQSLYFSINDKIPSGSVIQYVEMNGIVSDNSNLYYMTCSIVGKTFGSSTYTTFASGAYVGATKTTYALTASVNFDPSAYDNYVVFTSNAKNTYTDYIYGVRIKFLSKK